MKKIILTCEHGGTKIPKAYKGLFNNHRAVLNTHRGSDIGALVVAKDLQKILKAPLHFSEVTRLLIDLNRFRRSKSLFSEMTSTLSRLEKTKIINLFYEPHWNQAVRIFKRAHDKKSQIFHIAVHSMTDNLNGQIRPMQLALLYDPQRPSEKKLSDFWISELKKEFPDFIIARNNPYKGTSEGVTCFFRKCYDQRDYTGIELEMNQALFIKMTAKQRRIFSKKLASSLKHAVEKF